MKRARNRITGKGWLWLFLAGSAWLSLIHIVTPRIITAAYEERAPAWLNAVISGRAVHPLERYLDVWNGLAWKLNLLALAGIALFLARGFLSRLLAPLVRAEPCIGARRVMATALLIGMSGGVLEGMLIGVRKALTPLAPGVLNKSIEAFWMTPLGETAYVVIIGVLIVLLTRAWKKPVSLRLVTTVLVFAVAYGLLRSARLGIAVWPIRLLAAGIAFQAGAWLSSRPSGLGRWTPALLATLAAGTFFAGLVLHGGRALSEWRSARGLADPPDGSPNVVLLILDTVRARSLSLYGHERPTTPQLEMIAKDAAVFDRAISVTSWTLPSHASMLTGLLPWEMTADWTVPLARTYPTLTEALAGRGYATAGFVANKTFAGRAARISRGFHHFKDVRLSLNMVILNSWLMNAAAFKIRNRFGFRPRIVMDATEVSRRFLDWAAERGDRPFFAMLNFMDAHVPYTAPDSVSLRFAEPGALNEVNRYTTYSPEELREVRASYDAAIAYIDQEIGRIVATLRERGQLDRTILIVTADHGEQFGEKDPQLTEHGNSLYDTTIHVPLLIRYPAAIPAGTRIARTVGTRRIAATIMDLVGGSGSSFPGGSLVDSFAPNADTSALPVLSSLLPSGHVFPHEPIAGGPMVSARWQRWHYIRNGDGTEELFDVENDPWERENRVTDPEFKSVLRRVRASVPGPERLAGEPRSTGPGAVSAAGVAGND